MNKLQQIERIVETCQRGRVDNVQLDLTTASAMLTVLKSLSPENQAKFLELPVKRMAQLAWKLISQHGVRS